MRTALLTLGALALAACGRAPYGPRMICRHIEILVRMQPAPDGSTMTPVPQPECIEYAEADVAAPEARAR
jgi:hypothetical protein